MLRTDLIDLVNGGDVWAFVGSGVSIDAGCPSWGGLVEGVLRSLEEKPRQEIINDERYKKAFSSRRFVQCFSRIEAFVGRGVLGKTVVSKIASVNSPGKILRILADWPLAGYITTNRGKAQVTIQKGQW